MTCVDDSSPLRELVEDMEAAGCLLDGSNSGGEKSGLKSRLGGVGGVKQMSPSFTLS